MAQPSNYIKCFNFSPVILLHAATRKRNIKNKFANMTKLFKEEVTPMTVILSKICSSGDDDLYRKQTKMNGVTHDNISMI